MRFYAYACVCVEKRIRMRKMLFGVKGAGDWALRENTLAYALNAAASEVEHGPTF